MFAGLWLDRIIRGDNQQNQIDAARPREHVPDETFVAGNVDEADPRAAKIEKREAEIDGDAAAFFLGEAIGMRAGERFDEGGFAVVDVPGGANDDVFHRRLGCRGN